MRLPNQAKPVMRSFSATAPQANVMPSIDIWCMVKCLGLGALKCAYCLTSIPCWVACAGPKAVQCFQECS
ncbi:MAG: hypothetical protein HY819_14455 [Acidobacteria bacterium]|nr:hypothetical protein [Acidobacteriota bacterium]